MTDDSMIAIVGAACRFPDADTPDRFWANIAAGHVSTRPLDLDGLRALGVDETALSDPSYVTTAAVLDGAEQFAGEFFGYPAAEAETIDPPQRHFLEVCWEALEAAGHPARPDGPVTGVFAGSAPSTYMAALQAERVRTGGLLAALDDVELHLGGLGDFLTSRVAYKLGLRGPSVSVQTACSSSLTAVHYATLSLLSGECDIALAGGACVNEPVTGYRYDEGGLVSRDGLCRSFDARSTGTSFSSGVGVVALRRLSDALADGDPILAIVAGSAVGNDGAERSGFTAPNPKALAQTVATALSVAGVEGRSVRYVEAHGSGTALGDQIELRGLTDGLAAGVGEDCGLGSVKANIGHCGPAAGIAGLIKAIGVVRSGVTPPHPHFTAPRNPGMLADGPFAIRTDAIDAEPGPVLVNSMGLGGTNATVVLTPPPPPTRAPKPSVDVVRLVLSARNRSELDVLSRAVADRLDEGEAPADVAHTLRVGRRAFAERRVVTAAPDRLAAALRLPRPPRVVTARVDRRSAALLVADDADAAIVGILRRALGETTPVVSSADGLADGVVTIGIGVDASVRLDPAAGSDAVDAALCAAWVAGVDVDWHAVDDGTGRRLRLPTYPFSRRRYWALDRMDPIAAPRRTSAPAAAPAVVVDDDVVGQITDVWRDLFGLDEIGPDDEFGALGGTSLLSVRMALDIQQRTGVLVNVHRAGGSRATVRRVAEIVRGVRDGAERGSNDVDPIADGDGDLVEADIAADLGPLADRPGGGKDVLLTGATGFLGTFLLHELLTAHPDRNVYCVVRADDESHARERLRLKAAEYGLPEPDADRVRLVLGDLTDAETLCRDFGDGELGRVVGHVVHCAAKVVFTEPYRVLRTDNVLPLVGLLRWMRGVGIADFSLISTVAACGYALGTDGKILETRDQPLDPEQGGYGVSKWTCERILERAEVDGMRVRIFRPGFILGRNVNGACNTKDLLWHLLSSGLAVGMHPYDDRAMPMASVDLVARAVAELATRPGSAGVAYHLVHDVALSPRRMFGLLGDAGWATVGTTHAEWQQAIAKRAITEDNEILSTMALYELEGHALGERDLQADAWRPWLAETGADATPTGELLRSCLRYVASRDDRFAALLTDHLASDDKENR